MLIFNINYQYTVEIHNAMKYKTTNRVQSTAKRDKDNHDENFQVDFREGTPQMDEHNLGGHYCGHLGLNCQNCVRPNNVRWGTFRRIYSIDNTQ